MRRQVDREILQRTEGYWPEHFGRDAARSRRVVREALAVARAHGIDTEFDLSRFVQLCFLLDSPNFHEEPWAAERLASVAQRGPRATMNQLVEAARARCRPAPATAHG